MTTDLETGEPRVSNQPSPPDQPSQPDADVLQDRIPESFRTTRTLTGFTAALGLIFVLLHYFLPVWHTDVWGHLAYGRHIWESGRIPQTEPLLPLSEGMPFVSTAWLSQVGGYLLHRAFGVTVLQFLFALGVTACLALLSWRFYQRSASAAVAGFGLFLFLWVNWQQLFVDVESFRYSALLRPQLAGMVCFVALLVLLTGRWSRAHWAAVPALFALWANLHGSFPMGLALLAAFCAGRAIDVERRAGRRGRSLADRKVRRYFLLTQAAAVAVLLNPYGVGIYPAVFAFSGNANLQSLLDWQPLTFQMRQGQAAAFAAVLLACAYRMSPRRIGATELLLLLGLGGAALWTSRMIVWWAPVAAWYLVLHGSAVWRKEQRRRSTPAPAPPPRRGLWTVATVGIVWIALALTPFYTTVRFGRHPELETNLSRQTPVGAADYLNRNPPQGLIFNVHDWGDYLLWAGPADLQVFVNSHAHLVPEDVWQDYLQVVRNGAWERPLHQYGINTVVLDKAYRGPLISRLRRTREWHVAYEDDRSVVLLRHEPI